jgi:phytol kinase
MGYYTKDIFSAIIFLIYPVVLLLISKGLEKSGWSKDMTRKFVHVFMGFVILFIPLLFDHMWMALLPPIFFTIINWVDYKVGFLSQVQGEDKGNVGTILYPISFIILISLFYDTKFWGLAILGILAMSLGDAGASIVGRSFGKKNTYLVHGEPRSYTGSIAMFVISFFVALLIFWIFSDAMGLTARVFTLVAASFIIAGFATIIEALSIWGTDNITVPVLTSVAAYVLLTQVVPQVLGNPEIVNQPLYQ